MNLSPQNNVRTNNEAGPLPKGKLTSTRSVTKLRQYWSTGRWKLSNLFLLVVVVGFVLWLLLTRNVPVVRKYGTTEYDKNASWRIFQDRVNSSGQESTIGSKNVTRMQMGQELIKKLIKDTNGDLKQDDPRLVKYVRKYMLVPPSSGPYNLNNKNITNPSQYGQNIYVLELLQNRKKGFFVECGAYDGEYLSNTLMLEQMYGWSGLLIEANPPIADVLMTKNRKAWTSSACLSTIPSPQVMDFHIDDSVKYGAGGFGINSLVNKSEGMKRVFGYDPEKMLNTPVLCIPFYTYMLALGITTIDYFSLDVEASDFDVLRTIPFDKIKILVLEVEVAWIPGPGGASKLRKFMEDQDYVFMKELGPDYVFVHPSVIEKNQ